MLAIELAKLPPPKPARAATKSMSPKGVSGLETHSARPVVGISRSRAETMVQLRPPKRGTMNVYGMRSVAPTRLGMEMSQKISEVLNVNPAAGSWTTTIDHSCQTTKPRNSAKMDQLRLRRAMERPCDSHWCLFSASQLAIQRPGRSSRAGASAVVAAARSRELWVPASAVRSAVTVYLLGECCPSKVGTARFADGRALLTCCDIVLSTRSARR